MSTDLKNDVPRVAAAIDHLLEQLVKIAQKDHVFGFVVGVIKIGQQLELQIVRLAFDGLQLVVHFPGGVDVGAFAQLLDHGQHRFGRLIEQLDLFTKAAAAEVLRENENAFADFLHCLRYLIKSGRQSLNVFAFQRRDECLGKLFG